MKVPRDRVLARTAQVDQMVPLVVLVYRTNCKKDTLEEQSCLIDCR